MQSRLCFRLAMMGLLLFCVGCKTRPITKGQVLEMMSKYKHDHRVDDAIAIGTTWSADHPNDAEIRILVGLMYLEKAKASTAGRETSITEATHWIDQALQLRQDVSILTDSASAFEIAGDLSKSAQCDLYQKAATLLARMVEYDDSYSKTKQGADADKWRRIAAVDKGKRDALKHKMASVQCH